MKLPGAIRKLSFDDRWLQFVLLAFMVLYYGLILCHAELQKPAIPLNKTFNNMLDHLMHGQFDVDPNIIGDEGFLRNGRVYAYWGITCALLRLPLLLLHKLDLDITVWSCLVAVCLAGMMKVRTVLFLRRSCSATSASEAAFGFMLIYIVLGGAEVGFLMSSIYQEVVFWAIAFAAVSGSCRIRIASAAVMVKLSRKIGALVLTAPPCRLRVKLKSAMNRNNPASPPQSAERCGCSVPVSQA